jgi:N-acetylmuramoyl-L-alanine amidase
MAKTIEIRDGDCLLNICTQEGFFWETVWNHPNNGELKRKRKNLNILKKGDKVYFPDREPKEESVPTDKRHRFCLKGNPARFAVTLLDLGKPRANEKYILQVDGRTLAEGKTDANGGLSEPIPPGAREGRLLLGEHHQEITIHFGYVDPIDEISGVQSRLKNLGLYYGSVDDINGPLTTAAIAEFQRMVEITGEGKLTDETRQKLVEVHGS